MSKTTTAPRPDTGAATDGWKRPSVGNLPPLVDLVPNGDPLMGRMTQIDAHEFGKGKNKKERLFYRFELAKALKVIDVKSEDGDEVIMDENTIVTLGESGGLNYSLKVISLELQLQGVKPGSKDFDTDNVTLENLQTHLVGREFKISRRPNEKMSDGPYKGKAVKKYEVEYR